MNECWRDVLGYEGLYQVSTEGRVKSVGRIVPLGDGWFGKKSREIPERILKGGTVGAGYMQVGLCKHGKVRQMYVHVLVATVFVPNPHSRPEVNHKDGDKRNNRASNLEWRTHKGNHQHAAKAGLRAVVKLTHKDVRTIKARIRRGDVHRRIAEDFGVSYNCICDINKGRFFSYIE